MNKEYIYSQPDNTQEAATENIQREPDNNIDQLEEEYSKLHSADKMEFNKTLDDDYAMTEESSEYDVLRSKRKTKRFQSMPTFMTGQIIQSVGFMILLYRHQITILTTYKHVHVFNSSIECTCNVPQWVNNFFIILLLEIAKS